MKQRAWLLHYALFVFFNHANGRNLIIDVMFQEKYMQAVQQEAPYLLRYLAVAIVTNKKRRSMLKDLVKIILSDSYRDVVLDFVLALYVEYDFHKAEQTLNGCDVVIETDFFLVGCKEAFAENARMHVVENYCKVNKYISIGDLASRLNTSPDVVESWIANLIRTNKLNAKIDSETGVAHVTQHIKSVNDQIIEKTKALLSKTKSLTHAVLAHTQAQTS
jgi:translation initiation factor 3 subunit E